MRAYFAMGWDDEHLSAAKAARDIQARIKLSVSTSKQILSTSGFALYDLSSDTERHRFVELGPSTHPSGTIFGTVFERYTGSGAQRPITHLNALDTAKLTQSEGRAMITDFWGSYIAFVRITKGVAVIADPTSSLPCFYTEKNGVKFIFSHLEKCTFLDRADFSINYSFIEKLLVYDKIQTGETALNEINELLGGQRARMTNRGIQIDNLWNPCDIAINVYEPPLSLAAEEMRETTKAVVESHAAVFNKISVQLSGGLDSSIVLSCISGGKSGYNFNAFHHITSSNDLTEIEYAKLAAESAQCELLIFPTGSAQEVSDPSDHPPTARPVREFLFNSFFSNDGDDLASIGDGVFSGQGGDHLFMQTRSALVFADFLVNHGISKKMYGELFNSAKLAEKSIWRVMRESFPYVLWKSPDSSFMDYISGKHFGMHGKSSILLEIKRSLPSWANDSKGLPPAKYEQINNLLHMIHAREMLDTSRNRALIHPLISQPLIELSLRLPSYLLCANGQSRGLARLAFSGLIPEKIRRRTTKGSATGYFVETIYKNKRRIYETLVEGDLVKSGIITRENIENITNNQNNPMVYGKLLLSYYCVNAWLYRWNRIRNCSRV